MIRLTTLLGGVLVLGFWAGLCAIALRGVHPFAAVGLFLLTTAWSAFRLRTASVEHSVGERVFSRVAAAEPFGVVEGARSAASGVAYLLLPVFALNLAMWVPAVGVGMVKAALEG